MVERSDLYLHIYAASEMLQKSTLIGVALYIHRQSTNELLSDPRHKNLNMSILLVICTRTCLTELKTQAEKKYS